MTGPQGSVTFIGTATTLIRCGDVTLLTDPNFLHRGERAWLGHGLVSKRLTEPALGIAELPPLDAVVLSHLHGDHWDRRARAGLARDLPVLTTTHAARRLSRQGFTGAEALQPWQTMTLRRGETTLTATSLPGAHALGPMRALLPPVMGTLLEFTSPGWDAAYRIWLSGDTLVTGDLDVIARRFPDIDLGVVHLGGTRILGVLVTMDAVQGVEALRRVDPSVALPVHYDDYTVFRSPLRDFRALVEREAPQRRVRYLDRGEAYDIATDTVLGRPGPRQG